MAWQRFEVELNGTTHEVQTCARDWAAVPIDPNNPKGMDMTFRVVHAALKRLNTEGVPRQYEDFLDKLEAIPQALDDADTTAMDPTSAGPSGT